MLRKALDFEVVGRKVCGRPKIVKKASEITIWEKKKMLPTEESSAMLKNYKFSHLRYRR